MAIWLSMLSITYGNRAEELFERMAAGPGEPMRLRLVVAPSHSMKGWLQMRLADRLGSSLGFKIVLLEEAMTLLSRREPSLCELACSIEGYLDEPEHQEWLAKNAKRRYFLAQELAVLFQKYRRFCPGCVSGWQKRLWDRVFREESSEVRPMTVDLFGLSYLSPLELSLFKRVAEKCPVHLWILSPCLHFWADIATDNEKKRWLRAAPKASYEALEGYLNDVNPLLANFGRLGREMTRELDDEEYSTAYIVSREVVETGGYELFEGAAELVEEPATLLKYIQADILFMRRSNTGVSDDSVAFHQLPNPVREMEWVRELILRLVTEGITNVLVMAPDIEPYAPIIERFFADVPHSVASRKEVDEHPLVGYLDYYLSGKMFLHGFEPEEERKISQWKGVSEVLSAFMTGSFPLSDLELVAKWKTYLEELKENTPPPSQSLSQWADWLEKLAPAPPEVVSTLRRMGEKIRGSITYYSLVEHVKRLLYEQQEVKREAPLGQIRFSSLLPMRAEPAEALILIGMKEGAFPGRSSRSTLDLSEGFVPTKNDYDRTLFLECLLSAREKLWITWPETEAPSQVVQELMRYIGATARQHPRFDASHASGEKDFRPITFAEAPSDSSTPLNLKELAQVIKNPLQYYMRGLGIRTTQQEEQETGVALSGLEQWHVRKAYLDKAPPIYGESSLFEKVKKRLESEIRSSLDDYLAQEGVRNIYQLKVTPSATLPIHGIIPYATDEGVLFLGDKKRMIEAVPYLLLAALQDPKRTKIFCLKDRKTVEVSLEPLPLLQKWLGYAAQAKRSPYPFTPLGVEALLKGDLKKLGALVETTGCSQSARELLAFRDEAERLFGEVAR